MWILGIEATYPKQRPVNRIRSIKYTLTYSGILKSTVPTRCGQADALYMGVPCRLNVLAQPQAITRIESKLVSGVIHIIGL